MNINDTTNVPSQLVALTSGVPSTLFTITLDPNSAGGGEGYYSIYCTDGTNYQCLNAILSWTFVSKASVVTGSVTLVGMECKNLTSGTLVTSWDVTSAGEVRLTATTSLTPTHFYVQPRLIKSAQFNEE